MPICSAPKNDGRKQSVVGGRIRAIRMGGERGGVVKEGAQEWNFSGSEKNSDKQQVDVVATLLISRYELSRLKGTADQDGGRCQLQMGGKEPP